MHRPILTCAFLAFASAAVCAAQQSSPSDPYQGQSNPPADDIITTVQPEQPKPPAAHPYVASAPAVAPAPVSTPAPAAAKAPEAGTAHPTSVDPSENFPAPDPTAGTDEGIVQVAPDPSSDTRQPGLSTRSEANDPDGDIVHPNPLPPGVLGEGTTIRVRLLTGLSTSDSERGEQFKSRVASDVLQDGKVLIPAGAEIDGHVVEASEGHVGGRGSLRLRPDTVTLLDGTRYRLNAQVAGTPGTNTRVTNEGTIEAGSRLKKDGIEYGGAVGIGATTGAVMGGPVGALAGSLIGAGAITVHLLSDHPQARLEPGTVLLFTLNDRLNLNMTPAGAEASTEMN